MLMSFAFECVKCGLPREGDSDACQHCTWPFILEAWGKTTHHIQRVTLDTCCINRLKTSEDWNGGRPASISYIMMPIE